MNKTALYISGLAALLLTACDREVNQWEVDPSADGLFRPLTFEENDLTATAVEIAYTHVTNATHYIFEFSNDSLLFNNIVRRDTIDADTLTIFADNTSQMKVEYHTWFKDLLGETKYSVRMKAVSKNSGKESAYSSFFFKTPGEQIFTNVSAELNQVKLQWEPGTEVNRITLASQPDGSESYGTPVEYEVTPAEAQAGEKTITGLQMGTSYQALIYNGETRRGNITFRTSGLLNSETIEATTDMDGGDLQKRLQELVDAGKQNVSIVFASGTYNIDKLKVPGGIRNLALVGKNGPLDKDPSTLPLVNFKQFEIQGSDEGRNSTLTYLSLEDLNVQGTGEALLYMKAGSASTINITGCYIDNFSTLVNMKNGGKTYESITFSNDIIANCLTLIDNTGGDQESVGKINITQCTLLESGTWISSKKKGLKNIKINKCTLYNHTYSVGNMFRFDQQPASVIVTNCILGGDNNGESFGLYKNYDYIDYSSCFITKDMTQGRYGFTNINQYAGTSSELFTDPENGDFHIRTSANFNGRKDAGDPRWGAEKQQ